ncbi:hypothetical protein CXG46_06235 [Nocardioides alpinus]|uniref:Uncharacterized protein n=1 Tax=Nocardioides alpinus TaxID=748909 RepID=A0ABX4R0C5_9ACTN|nr:hypothetical protein CXG46_06235 [Nocardioides alpinus]
MHSLTEPEGNLVREAEPAALRELDEDQLLELQTRVQRARTKYMKIYRRGASASVSEVGGRGKSFARNQRARDKAEVFETVLAQVSRQVSVVARQTATELRAERIAEARAARSAGPSSTGGATGPASVPSGRRAATKTTGGVKRDASSQAQGVRRQAARDAR